MYFVMVVGLMVVAPLLSIGIELLVAPGSGLIPLAGRWFVFWAVGMRLFTAGLRQVLKPEFTARTIFDIEDPAAFAVVTELGVSNIAIGVLGLASIYLAGWVMPAALYGVIFYGVAAARHLANRHRNRMESIATWSDLWVAVVLAAFLVGSLIVGAAS
jgi:hypothetical protein